MTDAPPPLPPSSAPPPPVTPPPGQPATPRVSPRRQRRVSIVWLIPVVAALVGAWLVWKTYADKGPVITITFQTAAGLEAGKTKIKYRDVELGTVQTVTLDDSLSNVIVTAQMNKDTDSLLKHNTQFWVVLPRLTASGVSGLGTLFSGSYISVLPGDGDRQRAFAGLDQPPALELHVPGSEYVLRAPRVGSISVGSPIYYRGFAVGQITDYRLADDASQVFFRAFVNAPYDKLVRDDTRFWNASGIDVNLGTGGVNVRTESLQAILTGGIAFEPAPEAAGSPQAAAGHEFPLYSSYEASRARIYEKKIRFLVFFDGSVSGLQVGSPVNFRGMRAGQVTDIRVEVNTTNATIRIPVTCEIEPERFDLNPPMVNEYGASAKYRVLAGLVSKGLRAQLVTQSFLTGEAGVALDFFPAAGPAQLDTSGPVPVLPSVPSDLAQISAKATAVLDKLAALPLPQLINDARAVLQNADAVIASRDIKQFTASLKEVGPLLDSLKATSASARATLTGAEATLKAGDTLIGDQSPLRHDLARLITEATATMRSLKALTDLLQQHPEALIKGRALPQQ